MPKAHCDEFIKSSNLWLETDVSKVTKMDKPNDCPLQYRPSGQKCPKDQEFFETKSGASCCHSPRNYNDDERSRMAQAFELLPKMVKMYLTQTSTIAECKALIARYRDATQSERSDLISAIINRRQKLKPWKSLKNRQMLSCVDTCLYGEDQLIITENHYAFDYGDIDYLLITKRNPFTGDDLTSDFLQKLDDGTKNWRYFVRLYPLDQALEGIVTPNTWCPDVRNNNELIIRDHVYYSSFIPDISDVGRFIAEFNYDKRPWSNQYVHKMRLNKTVKNGQTYYPEDIIEFDLIKDPNLEAPQHASAPRKRISDPVVLKAIVGYHVNRKIDPILFSNFDRLHLKESFPQRLYRGLYYNTTLPHLFSGVKVGDKLKLPPVNDQIQSWTTDICTAEKYAGFNYDRGIVVSAILTPSDILLDSRFIDIEQLLEYSPILFVNSQNEILVKPATYPVKVEKILFNANNPNVYDNVPQTSARSDLLCSWGDNVSFK